MVTRYFYDTRGRQNRVELPDHTVAVPKEHHTTYHLTGEVDESYGARSYHTKSEYDHRGRLRFLRTRPGTPEEQSTQWTYHSLSGRLHQKIAPGGNTTACDSTD